MKRPKILIIGTGSLKNYGCEAIVHGTINILRTIWPKSIISVASEDFLYDSQILDNDIRLVGYKKRFSPYRIFKGVLRRFLHIGNGSPVRMKTSIGTKYDIVLSCGGDNYCEQPDGKILLLLEDLMEVGRKAVENGKSYVIWGASIGPFRDNFIRNRVIDNLSKSDGIFVREKLSLEYLKQFHSLDHKVTLVADPAFQMLPLPYNLSKQPGKIYVGINMSELAISHSVTDYMILKEAKNIFASRLDDILVSNPQIEFVFIPHVLICGPQDDMEFLSPVYAAMKHKHRVRVIESGLGARKTKGLISQLDLLVAARMHCCVAGISVATPTLFITYSNKGRGMSEYAYGNHQNEIECAEILKNKKSLYNKMSAMLQRTDEIRGVLQMKQPEFKKDSMLSGEQLQRATKKRRSDSPNF